MDLLVSTEWLANELGANDLRVVDATYFALDPARDAQADYEAGHIPGAVYLDLANLKDEASSLPGMLPSAEKFASRMQSLGLGDGSRIVLYDNSPHRTAARAWFMFRMFGVNQVAILDGGLQKWVAEGRPLESGKVALRHRHFTVWRDSAAVRDLAQMKANVASGAEEVVDARSAKRFTGEEGDPRGLALGHIPGSKNLPFDRLLNADGTFRTKDEIRAAFDAAGVDPAKPLVTTCGSGVTAAVVLFGAALLGREDVSLYDGSWSEWGLLPDTEKAIGPACETTTANA
ncbi:3-mercaptopyruvate sulfurtransferase [Sphingomonadaceae bacterium G21617-S1]|nr:3-mercaptopyruvate sulfurtransferase [Sphingomonadaceae bacterium G21617-S1]